MYPDRIFTRSWTLAIIFFMGIFSPAISLSDVNGWQVTELRGSVEWKSEKQKEWRELKIDDRIDPPMHVRSGRDGRATLQRGGDRLKISPNSLLFFPAAEPQDDGLFTRILQKFGVVIYEVKKRPNPAFQVESTYLTSLVKGTRFEVAASADHTAVTLLIGSLLVSKPDNSESVLLRPMQTASRSRQHREISITSMHRGAGKTAPSHRSVSLLQPVDDQGSDLNDASTFSWAEDTGLVTVTRTLGSYVTEDATTLPDAVNPASLLGNVSGATDVQLPVNVDGASQQLPVNAEVVNEIQLPVNVDPGGGIQSPVTVPDGAGAALPSGVNGIGQDGLGSGVLPGGSMTSGTLLPDTSAPPTGNLLSNPVPGGDVTPVPPVAEPVQSIIESLGL